MKYVSLDAQNESIKQFVLDLSSGRSASVLELNGQVLACVMPMTTNGHASNDDWSEIKNARRCMLIDGEIAGTLTAAETQELDALQKEMLRHRRRVAPLPLEDARKLHQKLMEQAQQNIGPDT